MAESSSQRSPGNAGDKIAVSRAEVILLLLLVVLGMGVWVWVNRAVGQLIEEPREVDVQAKFQIPKHESRSLATKAERKAIEEQLIQNRLELGRQSATTSALAGEYPELLTTTASRPKPIAIPPEIVKDYREAHLKEKIAGNLINSLTERLEHIKLEEAETAATLQSGQRSAISAFHRERAVFALKKPGLTLAVCLVITLILIAIVRLLVSPHAGRRFSVKHPLAFLFVIGALFILFAYQAFELAGAALVGVVALLVLFAYIPWPAQAKTIVAQTVDDPKTRK